jgi:nicotinamide-nucleotide amidase
MKIAIVTTGDEIMSGNVVDTNSAWIADKCWMLGHEVVWHGGVGDYKDAIGDACRLAAERAEIIFVTGGLGATLDDITLESAAAAFGKKMVFHEDIWKGIQDFFKKAGRECAINNKRQAYLPDGGKPLENRVGTAPCVQVKLGKAVFFFLPGVPRELYQIFDDSILPLLKEKAGEKKYQQKFLRCFGLPEASFDERLKGLDFGEVRVSFRVTYPEVKIKLVARAERRVASDQWLVIRQAEKKIREKIGDYIFGVDDETMEAAVGNLLKNKKMTIAIAESCTGGYISNLITNVAGSSEWFERGVISYSNKSKVEILGVKEETIKKYGAVSEKCAREMAEGVLKISGASAGLAVTGIAGPSGGAEGKPVGTVHIALATREGTRHISYCHPRTREQFKMLVAYEALDMVRRECLSV